MRLATLSLAFVLGAAVACSGSSSSSNTSTHSGSGSAESPEDKEAREIRRALIATCGPMCERLVDCSIEDLRANKTEEEIAEMDLAQVVPRAVEDCNAKCSGSEASPRQIRVAQECVNGPAECKDYVQCLDKAQRGGGDSQ